MTKSQQIKSVLFAEVPTDLHKAAKIRAIEEGRAVARLIEDAVRQYLQPGSQRRVTGA